MKHLVKAVFCYPVSICPHRYEQLTEMLADVEVDIFRPWVQNATKKKDTVVAVWRKGLLDGARLLVFTGLDDRGCESKVGAV